MNILAIDTSTSVLSVAVTKSGKLLGAININVKMNHSIRLMPAIEQMLKEASLEPKDLDGIAVAKGPGSYTGVRIGVTTAKMLAWSLQKPLVGVSSLAILAANIQETGSIVCPIFDARRGQVYSGVYRINEHGTPEPVIGDRIVLLKTWLETISDYKNDITFVGEDLSVHGEAIMSEWNGAKWPLNPVLHYPHSGSLAFLAEGLITEGKTENIHTFAPEYLQLTEAEYNWKRQNQC